MPKHLITFIGKTVQKVARLRGSSGTALPGLFIEKIDKNYNSKMLKSLPLGIAVISGTNGKTTTTKMVSEILESYGLKVFTNRTGSNFSRGITSAIISEVGINGKLDADIAVLELDEAHAVNFIEQIAPNYCLILNILRDQLDRYGEIDKTAKMLAKLVAATRINVVLNAEDNLVYELSQFAKNKPSYFGIDESLSNIFKSDNEIHSISEKNGKTHADVILRSVANKTVAFEINDKVYSSDLSIDGVYNAYNLTAAICLSKQILGNRFDEEKTVSKISTIKASFGRGEELKIDGTNVEIVLVKNPAGFRLALLSYDNSTSDVMIAINDNYADSRDVSWLWDVDFSRLSATKPSVTGSRAADMALRLKYDDIDADEIDPDISKAVINFIKKYPNRKKRIYCTYTAMLEIRNQLTGKSLD